MWMHIIYVCTLQTGQMGPLIIDIAWTTYGGNIGYGACKYIKIFIHVYTPTCGLCTAVLGTLNPPACTGRAAHPSTHIASPAATAPLLHEAQCKDSYTHTVVSFLAVHTWSSFT